MQIRFSKSLLATSCLLIIQFHAAVHVILAQNDTRNLPTGGGGAVGMGVPISRERSLINLIMRSTGLGNNADITGSILNQNKIISDLPMNQGEAINSSFLRHYGLKEPLYGDRFNSASKYMSPYSNSILKFTSVP